jgi:hypothetical protein
MDSEKQAVPCHLAPKGLHDLEEKDLWKMLCNTSYDPRNVDPLEKTEYRRKRLDRKVAAPAKDAEPH